MKRGLGHSIQTWKKQSAIQTWKKLTRLNRGKDLKLTTPVLDANSSPTHCLTRPTRPRPTARLSPPLTPLNSPTTICGCSDGGYCLHIHDSKMETK
ncbi:hypothetical protein ACFX15_045827 [Malus domestica]